LDKIDISEGERELPILYTVAEELRHCLLFKFYRQYLNENGEIYTNAMASDNPVFRRNDGKLQGVLAITPYLNSTGKWS
jgi:hypothetical protein